MIITASRVIGQRSLSVILNIYVYAQFGCHTVNVAGIRTNKENTKIYYSTNVNADKNDKSWTENSKGAKAYKIAVNELNAGEVLKTEIKLQVP